MPVQNPHDISQAPGRVEANLFQVRGGVVMLYIGLFIGFWAGFLTAGTLTMGKIEDLDKEIRELRAKSWADISGDF